MLIFFLISLNSCHYLQRLQKSPKREGKGIETLSDVDIDSDRKGSDSGQIRGLRTVYFGLDSSQLSSQAKEILKANKAWIDKNFSVERILLEGHCDPLGSEAYNIGLGERRARSVYRYLLSIELNKKKMSTLSYGEEKLFSRNNNSLNRRVNFVPQY